VVKYLRIAVTAFSLTACVLVITLWVRSYYRQWDISRLSGIRLITVHSNCGRASLNWIRQVDPDSEFEPIWSTSSYRANPRRPDPSTHKALGFGWKKYSAGFRLYVPYWFGVFVTGANAFIPWVKSLPRFSLRTLLIVTMLVAMVLGVIVAAM
jgi:hypothetical protein